MRVPNELAELFGHNPPDRASWHDVDDPRPELGTMVPLYTRMMRFLQGDPLAYYNTASTGTGNVQSLGNIADARSFVGYIAGSDVIYRVDGGSPNATGDQTLQEGSTFTLTGKPTIMAFAWASANAVTATIYGTFYD